jgi:hypothetical protein
MLWTFSQSGVEETVHFSPLRTVRLQTWDSGDNDNFSVSIFTPPRSTDSSLKFVQENKALTQTKHKRYAIALFIDPPL